MLMDSDPNGIFGGDFIIGGNVVTRMLLMLNLSIRVYINDSLKKKIKDHKDQARG